MVIFKKTKNFWGILPFIFSVFIFILTLFLSVSGLNSAKENNNQYFSNIVNQSQNSIIKRFALYESSLKGGLGLFNASNFVSRSEWRDYVETLRINEKLPGISGIGFIENVKEENLDEFLVNVRNDGAPNFTNKPETQFSDKFIIKYIVPEEKNLPAIGLDIGFEGNRRLAAEKARDTGKPSLTKKVTLVQDNEKTPGFLLLVPYYKDFIVPKNLSEKRRNFVGWVYAPFIAKNLLSNLDYHDSNFISFRIYDGPHIKAGNLIYQSDIPPQNSYPEKTTQITVFGNIWTIKWQANNLFLPASNTDIYYYAMALGFILSFLSYLLLSALVQQKERIEKLVDKKTTELSESQKFLYLIMNTIPDRVFVKDKDFKIVRANEIFMSLYPPEKRDKVIGYTTVENFPKEEADKFLEQDRIAFENGVSQVREDITTYTGEKINFLTTKVKFYDDKNEEYILGISRDISDLVKEQKNLETKVEERTREYKEQKILAEQAGEAKEEFLANMSHELRTPLNSIIGLTKIITNDGDLNNEQSEMLSIIEKASDNLLQTVNDILDISKIESGNIELESKTFSLSGLLHSIVDQCKPLASQQGLLVQHNLNDLEDVFIKSDEHRIMRIITNLTSNAIKYTNHGQIDIEFGAKDDGGVFINFVCSIKDTGIGIPEDKLDKIFDKFTQAKESTERLYGGTGLGLSITKQLVELMGGEITVKSKVGVGSVFTVQLPFKKSHKDEEDIYVEEYNENFNADSLEGHTRVPMQDARILVAEDHEFNKIFIGKLLSRLGNNNYKIVENGLLALNAYKGEHFDLILMDCNMPIMNGYEASRKIREYEDERKGTTRVPISAMTADVMPGTRERCLKMGMNEYITKPLEENLFKQRMRQWLIFDENINTEAQDNKVGKLTHVNLDILDEYTDNDKGAQKELIQIFYDNSIEDLERLKENCSRFEKKIWVGSAHRLKGSSSYIGASVLKNLCSVAETSSFETEEERKSLYAKIKKEHGIVCSILNKLGLLDI